MLVLVLSVLACRPRLFVLVVLGLRGRVPVAPPARYPRAQFLHTDGTVGEPVEDSPASAAQTEVAELLAHPFAQAVVDDAEQ